MDPLHGLYHAVINGDKRGMDRYINTLTPTLIRYLQNQMGATVSDAKEVVNHSLAYVCDGILQGQISFGDGFLKYIQLTCKHAYIKHVQELKRTVSLSNVVQDPVVKYDHLDTLLQKEREIILQRCILKFSPENQEFIRFLMNQPGCDPIDISVKFGLKIGNVYTKKSRILKLLGECVKREENR